MLYIRHGEKLYANNKHSSSDHYPLDPGLTEQGKSAARTRFIEILTQFGIPDKLISSPYLRTRETTAIAQDVIYEITGKCIPIFYEPLIGEYLGHQQGTDLSTAFHPDTEVHNPIPPETRMQYKSRIKYHIRKARKEKHLRWYISHGYTIQSIALFSGHTMAYPKFLQGILVTANKIAPI